MDRVNFQLHDTILSHSHHNWLLIFKMVLISWIDCCAGLPREWLSPLKHIICVYIYCLVSITLWSISECQWVLFPPHWRSYWYISISYALSCQTSLCQMLSVTKQKKIWNKCWSMLTNMLEIRECVLISSWLGTDLFIMWFQCFPLVLPARVCRSTSSGREGLNC